MNGDCPVSILIPARNERTNLEACLESCRFAAEVVVVDSSSTDGTPDIAARLGARVVNFSWTGRFPKKKNWALANIPWKHEWVFILDADERITPALADEIRRTVAAPDCDGSAFPQFSAPPRTYVCGPPTASIEPQKSVVVAWYATSRSWPSSLPSVIL